MNAAAAQGNEPHGEQETGFPTDLLTITEEDSSVECVFCKSCIVDEIRLGPLYQRDGVVTHYYCMLFSAALSQFGEDHEGLLGFLKNDIMKEVRRSHRLKCVYCNVTGASVGCCNKKCRQAFHFPCGLKNGSNYQFYGNYESFCQLHFKTQDISSKLKDWTCLICMAVVLEEQNPVTATCCNAAVFHKECMQKMALNAGYFFKCPTCNAGSTFVQEMRSLGIFVPEQDASWEKDNAFQDLYVQYSKCDAEVCECKDGREHISPKGNWMLARCRLCGAAGTHKKCGSLETVTDWACDPCLEVEEKAKEDKELEPEQPKLKITNSNACARTAPRCENADHVSARSVNRRVRNGNRRVKSQPKPRTADDEDREFDVSKVTISASCFSYFPYTPDDLRTLKKDATLPDWRRLQLTVNLIDWLPRQVQRPQVLPGCSQGRSSQVSRVLPGYSQERSPQVPRVLLSSSQVLRSSQGSSSQVSPGTSTSAMFPTKVIVKSAKSIGKAMPIVQEETSKNLSKIPSNGNRKRRNRIGAWNRGMVPKTKKCKISKRSKPSPQIQAIVRSEKSESEVGTVAPADDELKEQATPGVNSSEVIPVSVQEKAETAFFSAIAIGDEKLPLQHVPLARRRKQVFPPASDPNRKYFEVNGNILEVNYSANSGDPAEGLDHNYEHSRPLDNSTALLLAGHVLKMNVDYDVEISFDGEQIRIDESENSCTPKKFCNTSNWQPISKFVTNTLVKPNPDSSSTAPIKPDTKPEQPSHVSDISKK